MSNNEEKDEKEEEKEAEAELGRVRWELNDIRDELMYELDDLHDDLKSDVDDLRGEADDIKEELSDDLEDLMEEQDSLLKEIGGLKGEVGQYGGDAKEHIERAKEKIERIRTKIKVNKAKFDEKVRRKVEKAKKKAAKRINISVEPGMSEEWSDWAENLGASVSELVRKSMKFVKNNIGDLKKLEEWGKKMDKMGDKLEGKIEKAVKDSGLEDLGEKIAGQINKNKGKVKIEKTIILESEKERIKKRVSGLIKLYKSLPIEKLAQALKKSDEEAENLIYELAAEGIEGDLDEGVFKFTNDPEEVLSKLLELIDKI